jgi:hypothetical protein
MNSILEQANAILQGMDIGVAPPGKLTVMVGDTVRVTLSVRYHGKAISGKMLPSARKTPPLTRMATSRGKQRFLSGQTLISRPTPSLWRST